jgi:hypothetical protein
MYESYGMFKLRGPKRMRQHGITNNSVTKENRRERDKSIIIYGAYTRGQWGINNLLGS